MSQDVPEIRTDESGRVFLGPGPFLPPPTETEAFLSMFDGNWPRDGFLMYTRADDGKMTSIRASDVKSLRPCAEDEGEGTAIVPQWGGFYRARDPIEDLVARANILLGHTAAEVVPRRPSPDPGRAIADLKRATRPTKESLERQAII